MGDKPVASTELEQMPKSKMKCKGAAYCALTVEYFT